MSLPFQRATFAVALSLTGMMKNEKKKSTRTHDVEKKRQATFAALLSLRGIYLAIYRYIQVHVCIVDIVDIYKYMYVL
jgi:hypothetical protein